MARERGLFDLNEVAKNICDKLERRHPHVFEEGGSFTTASWEQIKKSERTEKFKDATGCCFYRSYLH